METKPTSAFLDRKGQEPFPNSEHKHKNVQLLWVLTFIVSKRVLTFIVSKRVLTFIVSKKVLTFIVSKKVLTFIVSKTLFTSQKLFNFQLV